MTKFRFISILGLVLVASMSFGGQKDMIKPGPWSGVIINSGCTPDEAFAEAAKCTDKVPGGKLVLYDDTTRQIFDLDPQDKAIGHLGDGVTVAGTLEGNPECKPAMDALRDLCREHFEQFGTAGHASKIKVVPLAEMARRYRSGALDPRIGEMTNAA